MLAIWESTTEVEQNFSSVRLLTSSCKSSTSEQSVKHCLKVLLDGPKPEEVAPFVKNASLAEAYVVTYWVKTVQARWRKVFGNAQNHRKSTLPRRTLQKRPKKGMPGFLEKQEHCQRNLAETNSSASSAGLDPEKVQALKAATEVATAEAEAGQAHKSLLASLQKNAGKKRKLVEAMAFGFDQEAKQKLAAHRKDRQSLKMTVIARRDLASAAEQGKSLESELCVAVPVASLTTTQTRTLENMNVCILPFAADEATLERMLRFKHILWCASTNEMESRLVDGDFDSVPAVITMVSRLCGGFLVGPEWFDQVQQSQFLVRPILQLSKACLTYVECLLHKKLPEKSEILGLFTAIARSPSADFRWVVRTKREELSMPQFARVGLHTNPLPACQESTPHFSVLCYGDSLGLRNVFCPIRKSKKAWLVATKEVCAKKKNKQKGKISRKPGTAVDLEDFVALVTQSWPRLARGRNSPLKEFPISFLTLSGGKAMISDIRPEGPWLSLLLFQREKLRGTSLSIPSDITTEC